MAKKGSADTGTAVEATTESAVTHHEVSPGTAVVTSDRVENPGFPPHRARVTELDPKKEASAQRRVVYWFLASMVGTIIAITAYIVMPFDYEGDPGSVRWSTLLVGFGLALALLGIGFGAVHWAKSLMDGHDLVEQRHSTRGSEETRAKAVEIMRQGNEESGFSRRKVIRNTLIGALALWPLGGVVMFRDLAGRTDPVSLLKQTLWDEGVLLTRDPDGAPIRASDVTIGSVFHVIPDGLYDTHHPLEEKAKAVVLLMRLRPEELQVSEGREDWNYDGIVAYSKICTHVGCPVALYEQHTHHLLCPCHQSQFDITREAAVIFGPAKRPLPQLPITVNSEGYLVARSDFTEPVGPSFWERSL
ncbi:MAG: Rieske 2Fe-2S domain-containing protein [Aeromicrobium sp.]